MHNPCQLIAKFAPNTNGSSCRRNDTAPISFPARNIFGFDSPKLLQRNKIAHNLDLGIGTEKKELERDSTVKADSKSRTICSQTLFRWGKHQLPSFFSDLGTFGKGLKQIIHNIIHSGVTFLRSDLSQSKLPRTSNIPSRMLSITGSVLKEFEIHSSVARNETFKWALNSKHLPFSPFNSNFRSRSRFHFLKVFYPPQFEEEELKIVRKDSFSTSIFKSREIVIGGQETIGCVNMPEN